MIYSVHWTDDALDELASVWTAASDRNAVTAASHRLEMDLVREPFTRGIRRNSAVNRTATDLPLGIDYDKKVRVVRVWAIM
jgi:hypothetical protein